MAAARVPPGEGIDETIRRLELREMLTVARRRLSGPEWAAWQDIVDYRAALSALELVEARAMDLPLPDVERIVPIVLERARQATGIPDLCQTIRSLQGEESALTAKVGQLRSDASAEEARVRALRTTHEEIRNRLAELEQQTNLRSEGILLRLRRYDVFQRENARLQGQHAQWSQACAQLFAQHRRLQEQIQHYRGELERWKAACEDCYDGLLNLLTTEDLLYLAVLWRMKNLGTGSAPSDNTTRRVAKWIMDLMQGETRVLEMPHRGPDGQLVRGERGKVLVDRMRVALSREDRELLGRLVGQASHGAEGPFHTIVRILCQKENGEPAPPDTGKSDENRRLDQEFALRHEAIFGFLQIIDEVLNGKRGQILMLPPCVTSEGDCTWYVEVSRRVGEAELEHLKTQFRAIQMTP